MAGSKTMTGHRAKVWIGDDSGGRPTLIGIFNNVSWGLQYDAQAVHILGRSGPAEIAYTGQEAIGITATGWRVIGHGPHTDGRLPRLQDLLRSPYLQFTITDRQTGETVAKVHSVRPTGYTTSLTERQLQSMTLTFMGINVDDEDTQNVEDVTASDLP